MTDIDPHHCPVCWETFVTRVPLFCFNMHRVCPPCVKAGMLQGCLNDCPVCRGSPRVCLTCGSVEFTSRYCAEQHIICTVCIKTAACRGARACPECAGAPLPHIVETYFGCPARATLTLTNADQADLPLTVVMRNLRAWPLALKYRAMTDELIRYASRLVYMPEDVEDIDIGERVRIWLTIKSAPAPLLFHGMGASSPPSSCGKDSNFAWISTASSSEGTEAEDEPQPDAQSDRGAAIIEDLRIAR